MTTITPDQEPDRNQYTSVGEDTFPYTFVIFEASDPDVYVTLPGQSVDPGGDLKILNTDYTVTNVGNVPGGTVVFITGKVPPTGSTNTIKRNVSASLTSNFADPTTFNGANLDSQLSRLIVLIQQNGTNFTTASLKYAVNAILPSFEETVMPVLGINQIWKKNTLGKIAATTLEENANCSTLRSDLANDMSLTAGSLLVGYFNFLGLGTTVDAALLALEANVSTLELDIFKPKSDFYNVNVSSTDNDLILDPSDANLAPISAINSYAHGSMITFFPLAFNTGNATVNVNGAGVKQLRSSDDQFIVPGEIEPDNCVKAIYNGFNFVICDDFFPYSLIGLASAFSYIPSTTQTIPFDTVISGTNDRTYFNTGAHTYTPLIKGLYEIKVIIEFNVNLASPVILRLLIGATPILRHTRPAGQNSAFLLYETSLDNTSVVSVDMQSVAGTFVEALSRFSVRLIRRLP